MTIPDTRCPEFGYGKHTERDFLAAILVALEAGGGGNIPANVLTYEISDPYLIFKDKDGNPIAQTEYVPVP